MKTYSIANWASQFENSRSRSVSELHWVPIPNRHDGENYSKIMADESGAEIFAAWVLMVQVASKCNPRGKLIKDNGSPHDAQSLSIKTRAPRGWFENAFVFLENNTDWLIFDESDSQPSPDCHPPISRVSPSYQQGVIEGMKEGNGMEQKEKKESAARAALDSLISENEASELNCHEFFAAWMEWETHRKEKRSALTASTASKQLAELERMGLGRALIAISHSIKNGWQGLFEPKTAAIKTAQPPPAAPPCALKPRIL